MVFQEPMKSFYDENGYLVVKSVLTDEELSGVRRRTDEVVADPARATPGVTVGREGDTVKDKSRAEAANDAVRAMAFLVRFDPVYREVALNPKVLELVRGLIGPRVKVFRDQMLLKPPGGQPKPLHQDQSYFRVQPEDALVTAWIALDEATEENGCMGYVPGSHRQGIFAIEPDPERPVHHVPVTGGSQLRKEVLCPVPAGSIIFHHGCTLHRSAVNQTDTWRRALILHFTTADAHSEHERLNEQVSLEID
jgi:ectoine hydroxylase-related dioxygenase (phytanoyl-CoA dioxygenase family)